MSQSDQSAEEEEVRKDIGSCMFRREVTSVERLSLRHVFAYTVTPLRTSSQSRHIGMIPSIRIRHDLLAYMHASFIDSDARNGIIIAMDEVRVRTI